MVFYVFLIAGIAFPVFRKLNRESAFKRVALFFTPFIFFTIFNFAYNFARFGNIFENGLQYHKMSSGYRTNFDKLGYFDIRYIPGNFYTEVLAPPPFKSSFPFFDAENKHGFGLFWASPLFLLLFPALYRFFKLCRRSILANQAEKKQVLYLLVGNLVSLITIALVIFSILGPGWRQFGSRYSLDYQLTIIIFILFLIHLWKEKKWFWLSVVILLLLSIYMNYFGAWYFDGLDRFSR